LQLAQLAFALPLIAMPVGDAMPAPVNGEPVSVPPVLVNALTLLAPLPLFATQITPLGSIAIPVGRLSPLLESVLVFVPLEFSS
jgi:hypothetical protein